jgi:hypothetical protein
MEIDENINNIIKDIDNLKDKLIEIDKIIKENIELKTQNKLLEEKLKSYTNSNSSKRYYEKNKENVKTKAKVYLEKIKEENPEKLKEWRRTAYLNKKKKEENLN